MGKGKLRFVDSSIEQMHLVRLWMLNLDGEVRQLRQLVHGQDRLLLLLLMLLLVWPYYPYY